MNKFLLYVLNHPLVRIFMAILSYLIYPIHKISHDQNFPATPKKLPFNADSNDHKISEITKTNAINEPSNDIESNTSASSSASGSPVNKNNLFPSTITNNNVLTNNSSIRPCATGDSTKLLPFQNNQGEIDWTFAEDDDSLYSFNAGSKFKQDFEGSDDICPTISNSSSNDESVLSNNLNNQYPLGYQNKGAVNGDMDSSHEIAAGHTPKSLNTPSPPLSVGSAGDSKCHQCPHCEATFKLRGYLTRHLKKHSIKKAYSCPFHKFSVYIDENNITHKCHPTGGFSRRDTYKTHLKSRHFKYPKGTKTKDRSKSSGSCSMCGEFFPNSEIWCEIHIEGGECKFLPPGFKGKSRIKNRLKKELKKKGYNINNDEPIDYTKLVNEVSRHNGQHQSLDLDLDLDLDQDYSHKDDSSSPYSNSDSSQSPLSETHGPRPLSQQGITSSPHQEIQQPAHPQQPLAIPQSHPQAIPSNMMPQQIPPQMQHTGSMSSQMSAPSSYESQPQQLHPSVDNQHQPQHQPQQPYYSDLYDGETFYYKILDYDDEFCLDVDQLTQFSNPTQEGQVANRTAFLQQQYQAMQNQLQMNLMMYQQQRQSQQPMQQQQPQQPQPHHPHSQPQGFYEGYSHPEGFSSMSTGLGVDEIHLDSSNLQPQYVQY